MVRTIDDVFGPRKVKDVDWMRLADQRGWAVVTKDDKVRRRPAERHAFAESTLRVFCLTVGNLPSHEQARRFSVNLAAMREALAEPGPWMYGVYTDRIARLRLYGTND